jgi:hypothetical protein
LKLRTFILCFKYPFQKNNCRDTETNAKNPLSKIKMFSIKTLLLLAPIFAVPVSSESCSVDVPCAEGSKCLDSATGPNCVAIQNTVITMVAGGEMCSMTEICADGYECLDTPKGPRCSNGMCPGFAGIECPETCTESSACPFGTTCEPISDMPGAQSICVVLAKDL